MQLEGFGFCKEGEGGGFAGSGRIEPTAIGGIKGKGFWLDGTDTIEYAVPEQPRTVKKAVQLHLTILSLAGSADERPDESFGQAQGHGPGDPDDEGNGRQG